ncbi:hypothetical protein ALC60_04818 [Trachymyrmex zeteki]|uniref:Uncharacterized protein n=1 Tax=Mycetomoellerius zeteki TaxID=64791 RepID=A0A151X799_9HYME|nr:hypothetical protein ALC60_04818 [Trachymyrmex zeteki]
MKTDTNMKRRALNEQSRGGYYWRTFVGLETHPSGTWHVPNRITGRDGKFPVFPEQLTHRGNTCSHRYWVYIPTRSPELSLLSTTNIISLSTAAVTVRAGTLVDTVLETMDLLALRKQIREPRIVLTSRIRINNGPACRPAKPTAGGLSNLGTIPAVAVWLGLSLPRPSVP